MSFKCKNCGSNLKYIIKNHRLECESCGSAFDVNRYDSKSKDNLSYGVYRCKSCGAQLLGLDEETTAFCSYCGTESYLSEKVEDAAINPKKIIPFSITKERVVEEYKKAIERQSFLPKEFKEESFMNEFRGIYIPYWQTSVDIEEKEFSFNGHRLYTVGKYDYYEKYDIGVRFEGNMPCSLNDASVAFDDTIAENIAPFNATGLRDFNEGYLAGFYADKATAANDIYLESGKDDAINLLSNKLQHISNVTIDDESWKRKLNITPKSDGVALFPVWFLTWRSKKRVAYSVVNGQTGKISTDLPVDYKEYFKYVGIFTAVLFAILSIFPIFVLPLRLAAFAMTFMWISSYILNKEIKRIGQIETHKFDYGFLGKKKKKKRFNIGMFLLHGLVWFIVFIGFCAGTAAEVPADLVDAIAIMIFLQIGLSIYMIYHTIRMKNKLAFIPIIVCLIIGLASDKIANLNDPHDYVNYIIAFMCLTGMVINALFCMYYINYLTTRPIPNFFKREGANHKYEAD